MKKSTLFLLICAASWGISSCKKDLADNSNPSANVPGSFDYATTREITVDFTVKNVENAPDRGVKFEIYSPDGTTKLATGASNASGRMHTVIRVPSHLKEVAVRIVNRVGIDNNKVLPIQGNMISSSFGEGFEPRGKRKVAGTQAITPAGANWFYMGTHNSQGVPDYLEVPGDVIDAQFIADLSSALPETMNIPNNKPALLAPTNAYDVHMIATGEIWITFLGEGAGALNTMGYYTYPTNNPPADTSQIDSIYTLFPNASRSTSGGGLQPGDKIKLGTFSAGTSIGWVMLANGWNPSTQLIKASELTRTRYYSTYAFNPEPTAAQKIHNVQLLDAGREKIIVGFEDVRRDYGSDHDFNDFLMYITVTPFSAVDVTDIPMPEYCQNDRDNDGVADCDEDYPDDPLRAFNNYMNGTLGFEDLWPGKGDYDFNDLVVEYNTNQVTDANNDVKDIKTTYTVQACGGSLHHGFGIQFDGLTPAQVSSGTGSQITQNLATLSANGMESGQSKAVFIVYDDITDHVSYIPGESYMNTIQGNSYIDPEIFQANITLTTAINPATVGLPPYNPFIFTKGERGREIHLSNMEPTELVNSSYFGTAKDDSNPGNNRYYQTTDNLPWAIHIDGGSFSYPKEYSPITDAYVRFWDWASSNGTNYADWYLELPGYRDAAHIY